MTAGRKPIPTHLKLITGNAGKRPLDLEDQPQPTAAEPGKPENRPDCPEFLDELAVEEWNRIVPELEIAGLLTKIDRAALAMYCAAFGRWREAEEEIRKLKAQDKEGRGLVATAQNGYKMQTQWLVISNKAQEQLRAYLGEFGMSPVTRTRVRAMARQGALFADDPMEAFLRAGNGAS